MRLTDRANVLPILGRFEGEVGRADGLNLVHLRIAIEGSVAAEEEVGDHAQGPRVDGLAVPLLLEDLVR